jgi:hypothetical protein
MSVMLTTRYVSRPGAAETRVALDCEFADCGFATSGSWLLLLWMLLLFGVTPVASDFDYGLAFEF